MDLKQLHPEIVYITVHAEMELDGELHVQSMQLTEGVTEDEAKEIFRLWYENNLGFTVGPTITLIKG